MKDADCGENRMQMQTPHIILILTDHFRRDALGRSTPNLSQLAAQGTRFENAYCAAPLCQPARNSIITGMYPSQHGVCGNQNPPVARDLRQDTFMQHLKAADYHTAMIGKHHSLDRYGIGMDVTDDDDHVKAYGFDDVIQVVDDGENMHNEDRYIKYLREKGVLETFQTVFKTNAWQCKPHPFEPDDTADGFIGCEGIRYVENYEHDKPLYLNLSFIGPHPPFWHPGELTHDPDRMPPPVGAPDSPRNRQRRAHYMDKCALIDSYVGRLIAVLKKKGMYENTVIVFTSDHGENAGDFGIWDKRYFYEQSCGVPLILSGPGIAREERMCGNRVSKALVSHLDLYPTFLALAGITTHNQAQRAGTDLISILGNTPGAGHRAVHAQLGTSHMIRTANWKMVFDPEAGGVQNLYNLLNDPRELSNLAGVAGYETVTKELLEQILEHRIRLTQTTQAKEEQRLQRVRIA